MTLHTLFSGVAVFLVCLCIFVVVWRSHKPKKEIFWLLIIFFLLPSMMFVTCFLVSARGQDAFWSFLGAAEIYYVLALVLIQTYPGLKNEIPSFRILHLLNENREKGLKESEILKWMATEDLVVNRIFDLENDSLIKRKNEKIYLGTTGNFLVRIFLIYRRLLGLEVGRG